MDGQAVGNAAKLFREVQFRNMVRKVNEGIKCTARCTAVTESVER